MTRKLLLLAGVLILTVWASSAAYALGPCTCTFCFPGSHANCLLLDDGVISCKSYRLAFCE